MGNKDFLNAVVELNVSIPMYPNAGILNYIRGFAKIGFGDRNAANKDFVLVNGQDLPRRKPL